MPSKLLEKENDLNRLLPVVRLEQSVPANLMDAARDWSERVWTEAEISGAMPLSEEQLLAGFKLAERPVFVCGVHRSGTTLLRNLLDDHPQLSVLPSEGTWYTNQEDKLSKIPESKRIQYLGTEWLCRLANPINQPPYWLLGCSTHQYSPYVDFSRYVMAWWQVLDRQKYAQWPHLAIVLAYASLTNKLHAKYWVDKTPTNEQFLGRMISEFPQAKIIHVVRHPFDTLSSRRKMEPSILLRHALVHLKTSFHVALSHKQVPPDNFLLIRYEKLCQDPEMIIQDMASFLQINNSSILRKSTVAGTPTSANSSFNTEEAAGKILKRSREAQRNLLTAEEQQLVAAYLGNLTSRLNYSLASPAFLRKWYLRLKYRLF